MESPKSARCQQRLTTRSSIQAGRFAQLRTGTTGRVEYCHLRGLRHIEMNWDVLTHVPLRARPSALRRTLSARPMWGRASSVAFSSKLAVSQWTAAKGTQLSCSGNHLSVSLHASNSTFSCPSQAGNAPIFTIANGIVGRSVQGVYPYCYVFFTFFCPVSRWCPLGCSRGNARIGAGRMPATRKGETPHWCVKTLERSGTRNGFAGTGLAASTVPTKTYRRPSALIGGSIVSATLCLRARQSIPLFSRR